MSEMESVLQIVAAPAARKDGNIGINGPERRAANVIGKWKEFGIKPIIAYPRRGRMWESFHGSNHVVLDWEIGSKWSFHKALELIRCFKIHQVDVVHTQGPASLDLIAGIACGLARVPLVITRPVMIDDMTTYPKWRLRVYEMLDRIGLELATIVVAISDQGVQRLSSSHPRVKTKIQLVRNGVDLSRYAVNDIDQEKSDAFTVGMVAQLTPQKSWPDFLKVIHELSNRHVPVKGLIVGDGSMRDDLEKLALDMGVRNLIEFSGFQNDVRPWLGKMDVFLFTSRWEGLSVAVIEAMASGLPIIATDVAAIREQVVDGMNGFVKPFGDVKGMADSCHYLWANPDHRKSFGIESAKLASERFSETRMVSEYSLIYKSCI